MYFLTASSGCLGLVLGWLQLRMAFAPARQLLRVSYRSSFSMCLGCRWDCGDLQFGRLREQGRGTQLGLCIHYRAKKDRQRTIRVQM